MAFESDPEELDTSSNADIEVFTQPDFALEDEGSDDDSLDL